VGGVARRATIIKQKRADSPYLLVLDAGDSLIGDRTPATKSQGQSSVEVMNMMGYDAMALGEGDLAKLGLDTLQQRIQEASFAVLSANAFFSETGEPLTQPYAMYEKGGHRIAVIGLTGLATIPGVEIRDPLASVQQVIAQLGDQADILILLSHAGLATNRQVAAEVPEIDLVISGGGEAVTREPLWIDNKRAIVHVDNPSPGHAGRWIGIGTWPFDEREELQGQRWEMLALGPEIADDPEVLEWAHAHP